MALDTPVSDASGAPSAPAPAAVVASPVTLRPLADLSDSELTAWRRTGDHPDRTPQAATADSAPATAVQDPPASTDATSKPAPAPALKAKTEARVQELLAGRKAANDRAERAERRAAELEARQAPADTKPAASLPATGLVKPDPETFTYGTSDPDYIEALTDFKVQSVLHAERAAFAKRDADERAQSAVRQRAADFEQRIATARTKHPDYDDVALHATSDIPAGSLMDAWIWDDEAGAEVLYELQSHPAELQRILALKEMAQLKELVLLGERLAGQTVKTKTAAPDPATALGTRSGIGADPVRAAVQSGDYETYAAEMNKRDLASRRR